MPVMCGCSPESRKGVILRKNGGTFSTQRASLERGHHPGGLEAYSWSELHPCGKSFIHEVLLVCSCSLSPKESQDVFLASPTNTNCCSSGLNVWVPMVPSPGSEASSDHILWSIACFSKHTSSGASIRVKKERSVPSG